MPRRAFPALPLLAALACSSASTGASDAGGDAQDAAASSDAAPGCKGIPVCMMVDFSMCGSVTGCVPQGGCSGTPVSSFDCSALMTETACVTQSQCRWNSPLRSCDDGTPPCELNRSPVPCNTEQGCSWYQPSCNGSPQASCEGQTATTCVQVPGCSFH